MPIYFMLPFCLFYFIGLVVSLRQRRQRGELIVELGQPSSVHWIGSRGYFSVLLLVVIVSLTLLLWDKAGRLTAKDFSMPLFWATWLPYLMIVQSASSRIYKNGIWCNGFLVSWDRIESYRWERGGFYQFTAIKLKKKRGFRLEASGIIFPDEDRRMMSELMEKHAPHAVCENPNADESRPTDTYASAST